MTGFSALHDSLRVLESLKPMRMIGSLRKLTFLYLGFHPGKHVQSYENLHYFLYFLPSLTRQRVKFNNPVEKHGKAMDDSGSDEFLMKADAIAAMSRRFCRCASGSCSLKVRAAPKRDLSAHIRLFSRSNSMNFSLMRTLIDD